MFEGSTGIDPWDRFPYFQEFFDSGKPKVVALSCGKELTKEARRHLQCWIQYKDTKDFTVVQSHFPFASDIKPRLKNSSAWRACRYTQKGLLSEDEWTAWKEKWKDHLDDPDFVDPDGVYGRGADVLFLGTMPKPQRLKSNRADLEDLWDAIESGKSFEEITYDLSIRDHTLKMPQAIQRMIALRDTEKYVHHHVRGLWIYGPPRKGKSTLVRKVFEARGDKIYDKPHDKWWPNYKGEKWVLCDDIEPCPKWGVVKLKNYADKFSFPVEVKYGDGILRHYGFIVTANMSIEEMFKNMHDAGCGLGPLHEAAILERFRQVEFTPFNRAEATAFVEKWRDFQDCTSEERAVHIELAAKHDEIVAKREVELYEAGCPLSYLDTALDHMEQIATEQDPVRRQRQIAHFESVKRKWGRPEPKPVLPKVPVLLTHPPTELTIDDGDSDNEEHPSTEEEPTEREPAEPVDLTLGQVSVDESDDESLLLN